MCRPNAALQKEKKRRMIFRSLQTATRQALVALNLRRSNPIVLAYE